MVAWGIPQPGGPWQFGAAPLLGGVALFLALLAGSITDVAGQRLQDRENAVVAERAIGQLGSPYCPGFMLEVCPSPDAEALRDSIFDLAAQGATTDQIVDWMVGNHGEEWRRMPKRSGAGLLAWIVPPFALLIGLGFLVGWLRNHQTSPATVPAGDSGISDAERRKLAAAMREWEATVAEEEE